MSRKRGGSKKIWKAKGRQPANKQYQEHCREQYKNRLVPTSSGGWQSVSNLHDTCVRTSWEKYMSRLG